MDSPQQSQVFKRYYHLFVEGELEELVYRNLPHHEFNVKSPTAAYDHQNWYMILEKLTC